MSNILVQNIKHTNGTTAQTIDSTGRIFYPTQPRFRAKGANTSAVSSTNNIILTATDYNVGGHYSTSTGKFTAPVDGIYLIGANIMASSSSGRLMIRLRLNDNDYIQGSNSTASNHYGDSKFTDLTQLSAGDYIYLHNAGNIDTYTLSPMECWFFGMLVA